MSCPTGPHFLKLDNNWIEHSQNIHDQKFGNSWNNYPNDIPQATYQNGWRYWSRPCLTWNESERTVKYYLSHVKNIMMTI